MVSTGFQTGFKEKILNYFFNPNDTQMPVPQFDHLYAGLFIYNGQPSEEPSELIIGRAGYERALITFATPEYGYIKNLLPIDFPQATEDWTINSATITHLGIFAGPDQNDELLDYLPISEPEQILSGNRISFAPNALKITLI